MALVVQKYGGSSLATPELIRKVAERVVRKKEEGHDLVVVVSAMGKTTDDLIRLAEEVAEEPPPREMDMLLSSGEQMSMALLAMAIQDMGYPAISLTGPQAGIMTDTSHRKARILEVDTSRVRKELSEGKIVIVAGFQGLSTEGEITTLGRGGSDRTAVALAYALRAEGCEIYTDVEGVFTADPRIVPEAKKIPVISGDEMLELASSGAKVMEARSVEFATKYGVEVHVRSTFSDEPGTVIKREDPAMEKVLVRGIALDTKEAKVTIRRVPDRPGVAAAIFSPLADANINVDMIVQNVSQDGFTDLSFTVSTSDLKTALAICEGTKARVGAEEVTADEDVAKVSVVGVGMRSHAGVAAKMFKALADEGINIEMITTSEIRISCVVRKEQGERAVRALHRAFELDKEPT